MKKGVRRADKAGKPGLLKRLFSGRQDSDRDLNADSLPVDSEGGSSLGGGLSGEPFGMGDGDQLSIDGNGEYSRLSRTLPPGRLAQYQEYDKMAEDPTIDAALKMHVAHAMSATAATGEALFIESSTDEEDPIVADLRNCLKDILNQNVSDWAYTAAKYGVCYVRPYGKPGVGITHIRHDHYTHPAFVREYERAGLLCGYTSKHQKPIQGKVPLLEPWTLVGFKIPQRSTSSLKEPVRSDSEEFCLGNEDYRQESPVESQHYGTSLVRTAFGPWCDLHDAILALKMARQNAGKKDRIVLVQVGQQMAQKAARYYNTIAGILKKKSENSSRRAISRGYYNTVDNIVLPVQADGNGKVDIQTETNDVNIASIEDVTFHVNRLSSALGVDKSLLGFTDDLSGGLGDGGFFRVSVMAAMKANLIRRAMQSGIERLCEIHVSLKHNKVFPAGEKPWKITFNSMNTAIEQEEAAAQEGRVNFATAVVTLMQMIDPELGGYDKGVMNNWLFTDLLRMDEQQFRAMVANKQAEQEGQAEEQDGPQMPPEPPEQGSEDVMDADTVGGLYSGYKDSGEHRV